jgi:hypothetical protein
MRRYKNIFKLIMTGVCTAASFSAEASAERNIRLQNPGHLENLDVTIAAVLVADCNVHGFRATLIEDIPQPLPSFTLVTVKIERQGFTQEGCPPKPEFFVVEAPDGSTRLKVPAWGRDVILRVPLGFTVHNQKPKAPTLELSDDWRPAR